MGEWLMKKKSFACEDKTKSGVWKITVEKGTWEEGKQICKESFGGFKFSVPKSGRAQKKLLKAYTRSFPLWLNHLV